WIWCRHVRGIRRAEIRRPAAIKAGVGHEQRNLSLWGSCRSIAVERPRDYRAQLRELAMIEIRGSRRIAAKEPMRSPGMFVPFMMQATQERELIGDAGQPR